MNKIFTLLLAVIISTTMTAQKLSLTDLSTLSNQKNWQNVNQLLLGKGWTYYNSSKGDSDNYSTITWSYNKEKYSDKAQGWFYLFTFDESPNKISYSVYNKDAYLLIQNSLAANGFKIVGSEIEDEKVISTYANSGFKLLISNSKSNDDESSYTSYVSYNITLIKKAGVFDESNGKKTDYYDDGTINTEYTLVNGKLNGAFKSYHENGKVKKAGVFVNGQISGKVVEYDEDGLKDVDYFLVNDKRNGLYNSYYYDDTTKDLTIREFGQYVDDEKNGVWKTNVIDEKIEKNLIFTNYLKGIKEGTFQEVKGDSLIVGNYHNDILNGGYKIYLDPMRSIFGGIINTKIDDLNLIEEGQYYDGMKTGYWKNYDISGSLLSEGSYLNDNKNGEWKLYIPNYIKENGQPEPFAKKLETKGNYLNGKLNGKAEQFFLKDEIEYPCDKEAEDGTKIDTCIKIKFSKIHILSFYKEDELNGLYEVRDSIGQIVLKGQYEDDLKEGKWIFYDDGNKIKKVKNYKYGLLDGEYIEFNDSEKPITIKQFTKNKFKQAILFNTVRLHKKYQLDVIERNDEYLKVSKTNFLEKGVETQVYWLKNEKKNEETFELDFLGLKINGIHSELAYQDGEYLLTSLDNEPIVSGKFYKNYKEDTWTFYHYDQKVKIEEEYNSENVVIDQKYLNLDSTLFSGEFEFTDTDKNIKEIRKVKDGLRNGKTTYIDIATNKTIRKENYKDGKLKV